ncbi:hypothetical protein FH972_023028 [Carpinus fangiana]|uniref:Uncharacterized protein n=1 Tax=Carpinus fangiana TaxID=176857 RepID=A0A5N6KTZ1_9ROSI|nr:hypothetical protein FH972_023028 [Carpinus fangiana]
MAAVSASLLIVPSNALQHYTLPQQPLLTLTQQARPQNNGFLPNGAPQPNPVPGAIPLLPNQGRVVQSGSQRILCVADVRGNLSSLNELAQQARADYILHTGDFGFYDNNSLDRIAEKTLKHVAQYSPLITEEVRRQVTTSPHNSSIKDRIPRTQLPLSQLPQFLTGQLSFNVPVYTVWGACEDVQVLEKLRSAEYKISNLHIIDESHSRLLEIGGIKLRLLGLGGALVMHKLFDNGEGRTTIAGGQGTMWTTLLQMGELVDTANRVYDPTETRVLVTHASPAREGLLNQLSVALKVDFSISAGLHFRYGSSYNEFSVNPTLDHYRGKLAASKASFNDVWETVKGEVQPAVQENEAQKRLLDNALDIVNRMPSVANGGNPFGGHVGPNSGQVDEAAFKNMWNFNLADAAFGWLVLEIENGRIGTEMRAQGFNFAHRGQKNPILQADMVKPAVSSPAIPNQAAVAPGNVQPVHQGQRGPAAGGPPVAAAPQQGAGQARQGPGPRAGQPASGPAAAQQPPQGVKSPPTARSVASPANAKVAGTPTANGTAEKSNGSAPAADEASKDSPTPVEKKPSQAIYVQSASSEEEARNVIPEADRAKIQRVEKAGRAFIVHFSSTDEMQEVLRDVSVEFKKPGSGKPNVREYQDRSTRGGWGPSSRGGQQGGYRSGGASDSEGGRGGRGGRGSFRGPRGGDRGGRGGRGGRGSFRGDAGGSPAASPAPAAS